MALGISVKTFKLSDIEDEKSGRNEPTLLKADETQEKSHQLKDHSPLYDIK